MSKHHENNNDAIDQESNAEGSRIFSIFILLSLSIIQIIGVIGLFFYNSVVLFEWHEAGNDEKRITFWGLLFLVFCIAGYFKVTISAYKQFLNEVRERSGNKKENNIKNRLLRSIRIPFNSFLDIAATIMVVVTLILLFWIPGEPVPN